MSAFGRPATRLRRALTAVALLLVLWLGSAGDAWAAPKKPAAAAPTGKSYVLPYAVVMFGVMLGMMAVCRTGRRADEPPRQEKKL